MGSSHQPCISWDGSDGAMGWGQCWGFSRSTFGVPPGPTQSHPLECSPLGAQAKGPRSLAPGGEAACGSAGAAVGERCCSILGFTPLGPAHASAPWQLPSHHVPELSLVGFCALLGMQDAVSVLPCLPCPEHRPLPPQHHISYR